MLFPILALDWFNNIILEQAPRFRFTIVPSFKVTVIAFAVIVRTVPDPKSILFVVDTQLKSEANWLINIIPFVLVEDDSDDPDDPADEDDDPDDPPVNEDDDPDDPPVDENDDILVSYLLNGLP